MRRGSVSDARFDPTAIVAAELFVITMAQIIPADHLQTGEKVPHLVYQALLD